jgi:Cu+-exporting ATPase
LSNNHRIEIIVNSSDRPVDGTSTDGSGHYGYHGHHHHSSGKTVGTHDVVDPVCGKTLDPHLTQHYVDHGGSRYHFCSSACQGRFEARPE